MFTPRLMSSDGVSGKRMITTWVSPHLWFSYADSHVFPVDIPGAESQGKVGPPKKRSRSKTTAPAPNLLIKPISCANHGAGTWDPTFARTNSPSFVGQYTIHGAYGYCRLVENCSKSHWLLTFVSMSHEDRPLTLPGIRRVSLGLLMFVVHNWSSLFTSVYSLCVFIYIYIFIHKKKQWPSHEANTSGLTLMPHRTTWHRCGLLGTSDFCVFGSELKQGFHTWTMTIWVCNPDAPW